MPQQSQQEPVWAVVAMAFSTSSLGELLLNRDLAYSDTIHLSWSNVAINSRDKPTTIRIHLKRSKCNQFRCGVNVFIGRKQNEVQYA